MNIYELEKQATPGRLTVDHDAGWWLYLDQEDSANPRGQRVIATFHDNRDEQVALVMLLAHCRNNFLKALAELRRLADNQAGFSEEQLIDHARVDLSLITELEEVKP